MLMEQYLSGLEEDAYNISVAGSIPACSTETEICRRCGTAAEDMSCQPRLCRLCYNEYMRVYQAKRYYERRNEAVQLLGSICVRCGSTDDLEIDHVERQEKSFNISKVINGTSRSNYLRELAKCQLLCQQCHLNKTVSETSVPHGGGAAGRRRCTCELCKLRKREYNQAYAARGKTRSGH